MTDLINFLNTTSDNFYRFALTMLIQSGILIALLYVIDLLIRKHVRAVFRYCIWMLVFVKLILPPALSLPTGIGYWCSFDIQPEKKQAAPEMPLPETPVIFESSNNNIITMEIPAPPALSQKIDANGNHIKSAEWPRNYAEFPTKPVLMTEEPTPPSPMITWQAIAFLIWLTGLLVLSVLLFQRFLFVKSLLAQSGKADGRFDETLRHCCREVGLRRDIELRLSKNMLSPAACGLFKPVILMPASLLKELSEEKLKAVLIHELAHIKRGDLWVNFIQTILQIIYFYNPLLWFANAVVRGIREKAVDEMVLTKLGDKAGSYSNTLIDIAEMAFSKPHFSLRLIGVVESKKALTSRIKHILSRPFPKTAKLGILGLTTVIITAAILLPMSGKAAGKPEFIIKGTVTDAQTGKPIAGARVGDAEAYAESKQWTTTDQNGNYEYKTWYEEHDITAKANGYTDQDKELTTKIFGSKKEKVIDFALKKANAEKAMEIQNKNNNAAYLYFKAFDLYKKTKEVDLSKFTKNDQKLTPEIKEFVEKQKPVIGLIDKASKMKHCDWKFDFAAKVWKEPEFNDYLIKAGPFVNLLLTEAQLKEADKNYSAVLDNCETVFRLLRQFEMKDEHTSLWASFNRERCYDYIHKFLNRNTKIDIKYLNSFNEMLNNNQLFQKYSLGDILEFKLKCVETALKNPNDTKFWEEPHIKKFVELDKDNGIKKASENSLKLYKKYINDLQKASSGRHPYSALQFFAAGYVKPMDKARSHINNFPADSKPAREDYEKFISHFDHYFLSLNQLTASTVWYYQKSDQTRLNILRTALPILIEYHKSGELPNEPFPAKYPNMLSNMSFQLLKNKDSFTLKYMRMNMPMPMQEVPAFNFKLPEETKASDTLKSPFSVYGKVTDDKGRPVAGVTIRVATGRGTLWGRAKTLTDSLGNYRLSFGPGIFHLKDENRPLGVGVQAAVIYAFKDGCYEKNLWRDGNLVMAENKKLAKESKWAKNSAGVVLPNEPYKLDFVMAGAAKIRGKLVDEKGKPIANKKISMKGNELLPATSVFANIETDKNGEFAVSNVPLKDFWFEIDNKKSTPLYVKSPQVHVFTLTYGKNFLSLNMSRVQMLKRDITPEEEKAWGEMVSGLQCRLRPLKSKWTSDKTPSLTLDLRNQGKKKFDFVQAAEAICEIEVDGKWYGWAESITLGTLVRMISPGEKIYDALEIKLTNSWGLPKEGLPRVIPGIEDTCRERLKLKPGKHTVRVKFRPDELLGGDRRSIQGPAILSNPVEIEIKEKSKVPETSNSSPDGVNLEAFNKSMEILRTGNEYQRANALRGLVNSKHPDVLTIMIGLLKDKNAGVRTYAAQYLSNMTDPRIPDALAAVLDDKYQNVRIYAALGLKKSGSAKHVDALVESVLKNIPAPDSNYDRSLQPMLEAIGWLSNKAPVKLIDTLAEFKSPGQLKFYHKHIALCFGQIGDSAAFKDLKRISDLLAAGKTDYKSWYAFRKALGQVSPDKHPFKSPAADILYSYRGGKLSNEGIKRRWVVPLAQLGTNAVDDLDWAIQFTGDQDIYTSRIAVQALGQIGGEKSAKVLRKYIYSLPGIHNKDTTSTTPFGRTTGKSPAKSRQKKKLPDYDLRLALVSLLSADPQEKTIDEVLELAKLLKFQQSSLFYAVNESKPELIPTDIKISFFKKAMFIPQTSRRLNQDVHSPAKFLAGMKTKPAADALAQVLLKSENSRARNTAAIYLGQMQEHKPIGVLTNAWKQNKASIGSLAQALANIDDPKALQTLLEMEKYVSRNNIGLNEQLWLAAALAKHNADYEKNAAFIRNALPASYSQFVLLNDEKTVDALIRELKKDIAKSNLGPQSLPALKTIGTAYVLSQLNKILKDDSIAPNQLYTQITTAAADVAQRLDADNKDYYKQIDTVAKKILGSFVITQRAAVFNPKETSDTNAIIKKHAEFARRLWIAEATRRLDLAAKTNRFDWETEIVGSALRYAEMIFDKEMIPVIERIAKESKSKVSFHGPEKVVDFYNIRSYAAELLTKKTGRQYNFIDIDGRTHPGGWNHSKDKPDSKNNYQEKTKAPDTLKSGPKEKSDKEVKKGPLGEVHELTINFALHEYVDLDTARVHACPKGIRTGTETMSPWKEKNGIDFSFSSFDGKLCLYADRMTAAPVSDEKWNCSERELMIEVKKGQWLRKFQFIKTLGEDAVADKYGLNKPHSTFVFQTKNGAAGVMQILDVNPKFSQKPQRPIITKIRSWLLEKPTVKITDEDIMWGKPVDGIVCGVRPVRKSFYIGETFEFDILYKNVSAKPITVSKYPDRFYMWSRFDAYRPGGYSPLSGMHANGLTLPLKISDFVTLAPGESTSFRQQLEGYGLTRQKYPVPSKLAAQITIKGAYQSKRLGFDKFGKKHNIEPWAADITSGFGVFKVLPQPDIQWGREIGELNLGISDAVVNDGSVKVPVFLKKTRSDDKKYFDSRNFDILLNGKRYLSYNWPGLNAKQVTVLNGRPRGPYWLELANFVNESDRDNSYKADRPLKNLPKGEYKLKAIYMGRYGSYQISSPEIKFTVSQEKSKVSATLKPTDATSEQLIPVEKARLRSVLTRTNDIFASNIHGLFRARKSEKKWAALPIPSSMPPDGFFAKQPKGETSIFYYTPKSTVWKMPDADKKVFGLYVSKDNGQNWQLVSRDYNFKEVFLHSDGTLYAIVGMTEEITPDKAKKTGPVWTSEKENKKGNKTISFDRIVMSSDSGKSWKNISAGIGLGVTLSSFFTDPDHPELVCLTGNLIRGYVLQATDKNYKWKFTKEWHWWKTRQTDDRFFSRWHSLGVHGYIQYATLENYFDHPFDELTHLLAFEIKTDKDSYSFNAKQEVKVNIEMSLLPNQPQANILDLDNQPGFWSIRRILPNGKKEGISSPIDRSIKSSENREEKKAEYRKLPALKTHTLDSKRSYKRSLNLSELCDFSQTGTYRVQLIYDSRQIADRTKNEWPGSFSSPVFVINIK